METIINPLIMQYINALSLTNISTNWINNSDQPKILHVFDEVCNLINEKREILSIVNADIGNGPFSLVIKEPVSFTKHLDVHSKISIEDKQIKVGDLAISFGYAQAWNPMPRWEEIRKNKDEIINHLSLLQIDHENETILQFANSLSSAIINADIPTIKNISSKLAGLGIGLTPAGDDFLMGAMYAAWMIHPEKIAKQISEEIANVATPLTTSLSGAWLKSAAKGEAGELWHDFFEALIEDENIYLPLSKIISVGETSGSDALMGFLDVAQAKGASRLTD
ncbi:MAG: DUF2877 domain-containing protein [Anaerolineales bacterium]|nr:DUF2877 domain-containing protein [Anaerolineales bacterium]